jgi:hypothetical protein
LVQAALDRVLARPHRIETREQALALLSTEGDVQELSGQIQKVAIAATPVLRRLAKSRRIPGLRRMPAVATLITVGSVAAALRAGVRDIQVVGSYLDSRLREATGAPPPVRMVQDLTVQIYLRPDRVPVPGGKVRAGRLLWSWLFRAALGRDSAGRGVEAVDAVSRLEVDALGLEWWPSFPPP